MATVPKGWAYYDASAGKALKEGQTMPTPAEGDMYYGLTASGDAVDYSKLVYIYSNSHTSNYTYYSEELTGTTFTIPQGWQVQQNSYTMTNASVLSSIAGKNVVSINLSKMTNCKITSINVPSTIVVAWFNKNSTLKTITGNISSSMKYFTCAYSPAITSVPSMSNATNMINGVRMFCGCTSLVTIPSLPPNLKSLYSGFTDCSSLQSIPPIPQPVIDEAYMCQGCTSLKTAPTNNSNVVKWAQSAFEGCINLTDASNFNIPSSVEKLFRLFYGCSKLTNPPSIIRGSNASAFRIFENCTSLVTPPVFDGSFFTLETGFGQCSSLKTPPIINHLTNCAMGRLFSECTSLEYIPELPTTMIGANHMFYNCTSLTWNSVYIPTVNNPSLTCMFQGCTNLTGIIWVDYNGYVLYSTDMFRDTEKPIVLWSSERTDTLDVYASTANNNNVYVGLNTSLLEGIKAVRCNSAGEYDDEGTYTKLTINFEVPNIANSKLYVPKVYIKNDQQRPINDWTLMYNNGEEDITIVVENSTDITKDKIEASDISMTKGVFTTLFDAQNDSVYSVNIPTSCSECTIGYDSAGHLLEHQTYVWSGTSGQAIFTDDVYIFDATPDGKAFKIGGAIIKEAGETGFIVGNSDIPLEMDQYPSTFNGPVVFNSTVHANGYIQAQSMIGFLQMYAGQTAPPYWLLCHGQEISRQIYAKLFSVIGTTYGEGNGSTTFNLPDMRNRVPVGAGDTYALNAKGGANSIDYTPAGSANSHTLTANEIPKHTHGKETLTGHVLVRKTEAGVNTMAGPSGIVTIPNGASTQVGSSLKSYGGSYVMHKLTVDASHEHNSVGGGAGHSHGFTGTKASLDVRQPYIGINFIIYAGV